MAFQDAYAELSNKKRFYDSYGLEASKLGIYLEWAC